MILADHVLGTLSCALSFRNPRSRNRLIDNGWFSHKITPTLRVIVGASPCRRKRRKRTPHRCSYTRRGWSTPNRSPMSCTSDGAKVSAIDGLRYDDMTPPIHPTPARHVIQLGNAPPAMDTCTLPRPSQPNKTARHIAI